MLQELQIKASELIYIEVTDANVRKYSFPQNASKIERGRVTAIQAYDDTDISITIEGKTPVSATILNASFVTLKDKLNDMNNLNNVPLQDLQRKNNSGIYERIFPLKIDFSQSEVNIAPTIALTVGEVFVFRIMYEPDKQC